MSIIGKVAPAVQNIGLVSEPASLRYSADDRLFWDGPVALVIVVAVIAVSVGFAVGFIRGENRQVASSVLVTPAQYAMVRTANIGPLEDALSRVPLDCAGNDRGRCTLSIAYALALTQKFQGELLPAPACLERYDAELRSALIELDGSLHTAALDNAAARASLAGVSDLTASDELFASQPCE